MWGRSRDDRVDGVTGDTGRIRGKQLENSCTCGSGEGKSQNMKEAKRCYWDQRGCTGPICSCYTFTNCEQESHSEVQLEKSVIFLPFLLITMKLCMRYKESYALTTCSALVKQWYTEVSDCRSGLRTRKESVIPWMLSHSPWEMPYGFLILCFWSLSSRQLPLHSPSTSLASGRLAM